MVVSIYKDMAKRNKKKSNSAPKKKVKTGEVILHHFPAAINAPPLS
jgi:hypothetical protein